ncbi:hypothetical protein CRUP_014098 [Coryphaenoides rupestris]|nr:hypothetical protein CRUP_014098 [Coryphaenoides rupestris]
MCAPSAPHDQHVRGRGLNTYRRRPIRVAGVAEWWQPRANGRLPSRVAANGDARLGTCHAPWSEVSFFLHVFLAEAATDQVKGAIRRGGGVLGMNSLGKSAKWPSYDSLSSTHSLLLSESEHTEDEADLLSSEGEGESGGGGGGGSSNLYSVGRGQRVSVVVFPFPGRSSSSDKKCQCTSCPVEVASPVTPEPSPRAVTLGSSSVTPGDTAFAQKCADLQKFVRPLLELLNGLKRGRFEKGLTGFQQSVAMDRLQRILGILQKPDMGEKYLHTLLQVEILLRMWFPPMVPQSSIPPAHVHATLGPLRSRHNQLHIPVKASHSQNPSAYQDSLKRKLSWLDPDPSDSVSPQHQPGKRHQSGDLLDFGQMVTSNNVISTQRPGTSAQKRDTEEITSGLPVRKLTDSSGALDDWRHSCSRRENETWRCLEISPPPSLCGNPATQDGSVSSSCTAVPTADSP